ncbi:hypothetical protein ACFV27_00600 [Streptomyces antimycoticus]|uniref:hypothetical protein n=1 Tax=Streptomyces antimycoticus TaxID=68175 RepID=UPI0036BFB5E3
MTDDDFHEPFGPLYERPKSKECPNCSCCSAKLCERGRQSTMRCSGLTDTSTMQLASGCPCSAETTEGTHAWRAARIRITRHATERPLRTPAALLLRALDSAESGPVKDPEDMLGVLKAYGYAAVTEDGKPFITAFGWRYLAARAEQRFATPVQVETVDQQARTAQAIVVGWHPERAVTVLLDQLVAETGLKAEELPGTFLEADANCRAESADDIVLTKIRIAPDLPDGWTDGSVTSAE